MNKKSVAVLFGGDSTSHEASKESAAAIISHMSDEKYLPVPIYVTKEGKWFLYDGPVSNFKTAPIEKFGSKAVISPDTEHRGLLRIVNGKVKSIPIDVVFPVISGAQGLFELAEIPYIGCGVLSSELCSNKDYIQRIINDTNLAQSEYFEFTSEDFNDMPQIIKKVRYKLGYPVIVKPCGVLAENKKDLEAAFEKSDATAGSIIVERAVSGKKIECFLLGGDGSVEGSIPDNDGNLTDETADMVMSKAADIFTMAYCCGLVQINFILRDDNALFLDEIKTIPDYTKSICRNAELIDRLIEMAMKRQSK